MLFTTFTVIAQETNEECPAFVEAALVNIGDDCANMGRDEVCYGYNRVELEINEKREWMGVEPTAVCFAQPATGVEDRGIHRNTITPNLCCVV